MTPAEIAEIAHRWSSVAAPWRVDGEDMGDPVVRNADGYDVNTLVAVLPAIAHAPQDVAALLGEVATLAAEVARMKPAYEAIRDLGRACGRGERAKPRRDLVEAAAADVECNAAMDAIVRMGAEHANAPASLSTTATRGGG